MRKNYLLLIIVIIIATVGVMAGATIIDVVTEKAEIYDEELRYIEEDKERVELINSYIEKHSDNCNLDDKFSTLLLALEAITENPVEYNNILYNLEYINKVYDLSTEEIEYIYDLLINGYSVEDVLNICYFWLDTNEDIHIIEEIYKYKYTYSGANWIENAFNRITNDKCGVLTTEDVNEYLNRGLTTQDIITANVLCRKGVLTIQEILESKIQGESFVQISERINGNNIAMFSRLEKSADYVDEIKSEDIITASMIAEIEDEPVEVYYQKAASGEALDKVLDEAEDEITKEIINDLKNMGIYKSVTPKDREEYHSKMEAE